jgi:hypothetical protein
MPRRPLDLVLAIFFALFALGWALSDLPKALGVSTSINRFYADAIDPLFAQLPPLYDAILKVAGFVYGPCYLAIVYALARGARWLPKLGVPLAIAMELTTVVYLAGDLRSATPPKNLAAFLALNGPYAVAPLLLLFRCARRPAHAPN